MDAPARLWCRLMHPDPMWPVSGYYRCPECLRQYPVQWESQPVPVMHEVKVTTVRPELPAYAATQAAKAQAA